MKILQLLHLDHAVVSTILILSITLTSIFAFKRPKVFGQLLLHPYGVINEKEYYRLFTSQLVHGDWLHLIANTYMLYVSCVSLENYLCSVSHSGSIIFFGVYFLSLISGASLTSLRHFRDVGFTSAGASGVVMGCIFCFMILNPDFVAFYLPYFGPVKNVYAALIFILLLLRLQFSGQKYLNHELHLYSALSGIFCGILIKHCL